MLPVLGVYAFAGLRLFPSLQQVYSSFTGLRFARPTLDKLHADLMETRGGAAPDEPSSAALRLQDRLELAGVEFAYPRAERQALRGVDMTIPARTTVGLVGGTGAGKTTVVDLILGLLEPQKGAIRVDGTPITAANRRAWQRAIGYVPQAIFLTDESVASNIAFGLPPEAIDRAAVERAARIAELHDFVMTELPQGYDTAGRRARGAALRRPAPAHRHRPRALPRPRRPDHGRGDLGARQPDRAGGDGRRAQPRPRQDHRADRAPALDGAGPATSSS